jgi:hypothetical protein
VLDCSRLSETCGLDGSRHSRAQSRRVGRCCRRPGSLASKTRLGVFQWHGAAGGALVVSHNPPLVSGGGDPAEPSRSKMRREVPALRIDANGLKRGCRPHAPVGGGDCDDGVLAPVLDAVGWCLSLRLCRGRPRPQCRSSGSAPCYTCRQRRTSHESHRLHRFTRALGHGGKRAFVRAGAGGAAALCTL